MDSGSGTGARDTGADPADVLVRQLWRERRRATPNEREQIQRRIASAPFNPDLVDVPPEFRGKTFGRERFGTRAESLLVHLAQRVWDDKQWRLSTTEGEYLADLRRAAGDDEAELVVYERRHGLFVGVLAPNRLSPRRLGRAPGALMYVVYSAHRGILVTGYQVAHRRRLLVPGDSLWLRA